MIQHANISQCLQDAVAQINDAGVQIGRDLGITVLLPEKIDVTMDILADDDELIVTGSSVSAEDPSTSTRTSVNGPVTSTSTDTGANSQTTVTNRSGKDISEQTRTFKDLDA